VLLYSNSHLCKARAQNVRCAEPRKLLLALRALSAAAYAGVLNQQDRSAPHPGWLLPRHATVSLLGASSGAPSPRSRTLTDCYHCWTSSDQRERTKATSSCISITLPGLTWLLFLLHLHPTPQPMYSDSHPLMPHICACGDGGRTVIHHHAHPAEPGQRGTLLPTPYTRRHLTWTVSAHVL
jgi:hypothetical protein